MVEVTIENVDQQYDEEGEEVVSYVVEYRIPQYDNLYRTEPIRADEFDQEYAKELVAKEASPLIVAPEIEVKFPSETSKTDTTTSSGTTGVSRRWLVVGGVGSGIVGLVGGWLVSGQNAHRDSTAAISTAPSNNTNIVTTDPPESPEPTSSPTEDRSPTETSSPTDKTSTETPSEQGDSSAPFTETFEDGAEDWTFGKRRDEDASKGTGSWSEKHGGSLRLHVNGAPETIMAWKEVGPLEKGTTITADYVPQRFEYAAAGLFLSAVIPDEEVVVSDRDSDNGDNPEQDGNLKIEVPRDLPAKAQLEIKLVIWPGETTVFIKQIDAQ